MTPMMLAVFVFWAQSAAAPIQKTIDPPSGAISPVAWTIIVALTTAIGGMALFIKMLYNKLNDCQEARVKHLEDQLSLMKTLRDEFDKPQGGKP